ncbi:MAG: Transposase, Mutator family [Methanoregulaceae archaeon PtaB.Bin009]|jgi:hypothetical protein|nr:MAG: Transposase, Mutator family [Methanoregulaceae archaeon PtaB.Bin009]
MDIVHAIEVKVCISEDQRIPIESLVASVKRLQIEEKLLEHILVGVNDILVDSYCGEKYSRRSPEARYIRAGTSEKTIVTSVGSITLKLDKVRDVQKNRIWKPLTDVVQFAGKQLYQPDISMISIDFVQKLSYRDTTEELGIVIPEVPSRMTINNRIKQMSGLLEVNEIEIPLMVAMADGTKAHSQEAGKKQNDINVVLGVSDERKILLGVTVNQSWKCLSDLIDTDETLAENAIIVSDGEPELRAAFADEDIHFQTDLIHGFRLLGYKLWEDGILTLKERKGVIIELKMLLLSLKNVVLFHKSDHQRVRDKINQVVEGMEYLANRLIERGCRRAAVYLNMYSNTLVTFARLSLNGIKVPWNSNMIERLMGEISKRVKHKWMRWTSRGLEAILRFILVRYTSPWLYRRFRNEYLGLHGLSSIAIQISIETRIP